MRHQYALREETIKVLNGHCPAVANEWGVSASYVYGIIEGVNPDPFAYFLPVYRAAVNAGCDTGAWDAAFHAIKARHCVVKAETPHCSLSKKITTDADSTRILVDALEDGEIDEIETRAIRRAMQKTRDILDEIDAQLERPERRAKADANTKARFAR